MNIKLLMLITFISLVAILAGCKEETIRGMEYNPDIRYGSLDIPFYAGKPAPLSTVQQSSKLVATVTSDASALAVDGMTWTDCKSLFVDIPYQWNAVSFSFYGYGDGDGDGDPNDTTFSYDVYFCDYYGGVECASSANTGTIGGQQLSHNPVTGAELNSGSADSDYCWADDLNEGTLKWSKSFYYSDYESTNGRAKTKIDRQESCGVYVRIYDMTAQSVTSVTCIINGY